MLKNSKTSSRVLLDVDESLIQNNLIIQKPTEEEKELESLFQSTFRPDYPYKTVQPDPGFCVKTRNLQNEKLFINFCHTDIIPAPEDISDEELTNILESEDPSTFKIPMSLGESHEETDKSGNGCLVYDVAINKNFYVKTISSGLWQTFLLAAALEGLEDKNNIQLDKKDWVILKNKKSMGKILAHNIQQRQKPKLQEIRDTIQTNKPLIKEMTSENAPIKIVRRKPHYQIIKEPSAEDPEYLVASFQLPEIVSSKDVTVDLSEDRIILESKKYDYFLDIFIPYNISSERSAAQFDINKKVLTLSMPIEE